MKDAINLYNLNPFALSIDQVGGYKLTFTVILHPILIYSVITDPNEQNIRTPLSNFTLNH